MINHLSSRSLPLISNPHFQTIFASLIPAKKFPPSTAFLVPLDDGDTLCCEMSVPRSWKPPKKTILMIHGLGGSHASNYMVRISRKLYKAGYRVIRINLRGCGSGNGLAGRPYHAGKSDDVLKVINLLKKESPDSPLMLIGFSLGGNIALKLSGEIGKNSEPLLHSTIAICPPIDLRETISLLALPCNRIYNRMYLNELKKYASSLMKNSSINSIYDYDAFVTVPEWGYSNTAEFYKQSSSRFFLSSIKHPCRILFAKDDPFISYKAILEEPFSSHVKIWLSKHGGHMGFLKWSGRKHLFFWLDHTVINWVEELDEKAA